MLVHLAEHKMACLYGETVTPLLAHRYSIKFSVLL